MRYIKVLLLVLVFFLSMVFFFQNQASLSKEMVLNLNLFFTAPMKSIPLPFYFLVLAAFLLGAIVTLVVLVWDKMHLSARYMKASWRIRALEKEVDELQALHAEHPAGGVRGFFSRKPKQAKPVEAPAAVAAAPVTAVSEAAAAVEDVKAPDPDKQA